MHDLEKIMEAKKTLSSWLDEELQCGKEAVGCHVEQVGEIVDMIKDLAETEEKCVKACYYMEIIKAMNEEGGELSERYGYDHYRYSSGRFAPKGHGHYSAAGYTPFKGNVRIHEPYLDETIRMGYPKERNDHMDMDGMNNRYGMNMSMSDKGRYYDEWQDAKRHYHEMPDDESRKKMNEKMSHNITEVVEQIREMSEDASPEMQKELHDKVSKALNTMNRMM